ncbi:MAG: glycosyltransferase family 2 protein [Candidatus Saccharimonadales bacterium]
MSAANECANFDQPEISVVIPAYNEGGGSRAGLFKQNTEDILARLDDNFKRQQYEVLAIDDGSVDNTAQIAADAGLKVLRYEQNRGKGAALRLGMLAARGGVKAMIDADGSYPPEVLLKFYESIKNGADIAVGTRAENSGQHDGRLRAIGHATLPWALEKIASTGDVKDVQAGAKAFRGNVADEIWPQVTSERYGADRQALHIAHLMGLTIDKIPTEVSVAPESHVRAADSFGLISEAMKTRRQGLSLASVEQLNEELLAQYKYSQTPASVAA